jgi:hypothetical protein
MIRTGNLSSEGQNTQVFSDAVLILFDLSMVLFVLTYV